MEGAGGFTRSIIDKLHSLDMVKWKVKVMLLEVSSMNLILGMSKECKWKVKIGVTRSIIDELHSSDIQGD